MVELRPFFMWCWWGVWSFNFLLVLHSAVILYVLMSWSQAQRVFYFACNRFGALDQVGLKGSQTFNQPNIILTSGFGVVYLRFDHEWSGCSCLFSQLSGPFIPIIINLHNKDGLCTVYDWLCTTGQENWLCRASIRRILQPGLISLHWNWNVFCYLF